VPNIPTGHGLAVVPFHHVATARAAVITFGFLNATGGNNPNVIAESIQDSVGNILAPVIDSNVTIGPVGVTLGPSSAPLSGSASSTNAGGSSISSVPGNTALLVQKRTATGGRPGRGRYFIPWALEESDVSEVGVISGGTVTAHQDVQDDFLADLSTRDVPMEVLHTGVGTPSAVTALVVQPLVATQRQRIRP
jgi:hypothetical protein